MSKRDRGADAAAGTPGHAPAPQATGDPNADLPEVSDARDSVGEWIVYYRERAGMSQAALSRAAGLSQSTLSLIESGGNTTVETLQNVARALDVTVHALFGAPVEGLVPQDAVLFRELLQLPDDVRDEMRDYMDFLRQKRAGPKKDKL